MTAGHLDRASAGFAEGERYDRARPGYPEPAIDALCDVCGIGPGRTVVDIAAGTGKLTRALVARGAQVTAVEPVPGMRDELTRQPEAIAVVAGTAEHLPFDAATFDAATVGQAFHWFDGPAALREIRRILTPGGAIGLIWNVMDQRVRWVKLLQELIHRHRGDNPWYSDHEWRSAFTSECGFAPLAHRAFPNTQTVDVAGLVDRIASVSFIATLPEARRTGVFDEVRSLVARELRGQETFAIPYVTDVFWARCAD